MTNTENPLSIPDVGVDIEQQEIKCSARKGPLVYHVRKLQLLLKQNTHTANTHTHEMHTYICTPEIYM